MYDAYRPPAAPSAPLRKPFWSRPKVGTAGVALGLLLGVIGSSGADAEDQAGPAAPAPLVQTQAATEEGRTEVDAEVDAAVDAAVARAVQDATGDLEDELAAAQEQSAADLQDLRRRARRAQTVAVDRAVANALADLPEEQVAEPEDEPVVEPQPTGSTDPAFDTCGDAKDAGYGPYHAGQDPEYDWYDDRDDDGIVCE